MHATGDPGDVMAALGQAGYAIIPDAIPAAQAAAARADLEAILETTPPGRDEFEGRRTRRVYALFAKTRTLDTLALHPVVLGVLDQILGHYALSAPAAIAIGPGQGHQPLHRDDAIYPIARPRPELVVNVMWPLTEFTQANGATRLVPGSHRWEDDKLPAQPPVRVAEMTPGSALIYTGSVWHGGGANGTAQRRVGSTPEPTSPRFSASFSNCRETNGNFCRVVMTIGTALSSACASWRESSSIFCTTP